MITTTLAAGDLLGEGVPVRLRLLEIPQAVKRRLKRDDERSWIILSELNRTPWPNQDTRVVPGSKPETIVYGQLPEALYNKVRDRWLELVDRRLVKVVARTE